MYDFVRRTPSAFVVVVLLAVIVVLFAVQTMVLSKQVWLANARPRVRYTEKLNCSVCEIPKQERFLTIRFESFRCCGMGNQLFELVSGLGIARHLNRTFYLRARMWRAVRIVSALVRAFPNLVDYVHIRYQKRDEYALPIGITGGKCCVYANLSALERAANRTSIVVTSPFLQSFKYFDDIREEVHSTILKFNSSFEEIARTKLFAADVMSESTYRLCVHTRRGDFIEDNYTTFSTESFTVASSQFLASQALQSNGAVSVLLFGDDRSWAKLLIKEWFDNESRFSVRVANELPRMHPAVHLAFARYHCDSVLLTAPMSTFGWWMAYLAWSARNVTVFYRERLSLPDGIESEVNRNDFFPPSWTPLSDVDVFDENLL